MTNTRITDPEILERRYPVVLRRFELRAGSGGDGLHRGGDGVVREVRLWGRWRAGSRISRQRSPKLVGDSNAETRKAPSTCWLLGWGCATSTQLEALRPLSAGILSERRSVAPFGLQGGLPGAPGLNLLVRHTTGRTVNLGERRRALPWSGVPCLRASSALAELAPWQSCAYLGNPLTRAGGKSTFQMQAGDRLVILTPGAGAFGAAPPGSLAEEERAPQGGSGVVSTMHNAEVVGAKRARAAAGQQEGSTNGEGGGRRVQLKGSVYEYQRQQESA